MPKARKNHPFRRFRALHLWLAATALAAVLFELFKGNRVAMNFLVERVTTPVKRAMTVFTSLFRFSIGEWLVYLSVLLAIAWLVLSVVRFIRARGGRGAFAYGFFLKALCATLSVYTAFNLMWGINYYADTFQDKSGIHALPVGKQQLYDTTLFFTQKLNDAARLVPRNGDGVFSPDREWIVEQSAHLYQNIEPEFPFLAGKAAAVKPVAFSELLSYMDTTGFYFPFTAEANYNAHSPLCLAPSTIAHEIAHQRNIASEQEANFVAVVVCDRSGIPEYAYSGYLLAYIHLSNALFNADVELWQTVRGTLDEGVLSDLADYNAYWEKYETPVAQTARQMNDSRLKSYGQTLGTQSYGAVVDLLVAYYAPPAGS